MRASIVRCHDLDVEHPVTPVDVVLDPNVGELDVPVVVARQLVLLCPGADLLEPAVGSAITVIAIAISFLQELLVLALEVVLQKDTVDVGALVAQPLGFIDIGRYSCASCFSSRGFCTP